jgi:hypothetical protein
MFYQLELVDALADVDSLDDLENVISLVDDIQDNSRCLLMEEAEELMMDSSLDNSYLFSFMMIYIM